MKRIPPLFVALLLSLGLLSSGDGGPEWHDDLEQARALAADEGRLMLVVFR